MEEQQKQIKRIPWNKGLTKETDERIKKSADKNRGQERPKTREWHMKNKISENPKGMYGLKASEEWKNQKKESMIKYHKENKGTEKYKKRCENISKSITGKKRLDMIGNKFKIGTIPHNKNLEIRKKSQEIIQLYKDELMNTKEIGNIFGCSPYLIENILRENKENMSRSERRNKLMKAEKIKVWNDGIGFYEPYDNSFNNKFKRAIRKRDNQICMMCGIHKEKLSRALSIHHINYDKKCSIPQNCISLCGGCHALTQTRRKHYTKFFQSLLSERYDYQYSENQEIILNINGEKQF